MTWDSLEERRILRHNQRVVRRVIVTVAFALAFVIAGCVSIARAADVSQRTARSIAQAAVSRYDKNIALPAAGYWTCDDHPLKVPVNFVCGATLPGGSACYVRINVHAVNFTTGEVLCAHPKSTYWSWRVYYKTQPVFTWYSQSAIGPQP